MIPGASRGAEQPWAQPVAEVAALLRVDPAAGLGGGDARDRLAAGRNELAEHRAPSLPGLLLGAAREPFVLLLLGAGILAILVGEVRDGVLVLVGLVPIVGADVITEYRAERALDTLRAAAAPTAMVRRDGTSLEIPAAELVPGDVVLLRVGDVVPADLRLARAAELEIDRSILTGESAPEPGLIGPDPEDATVADRHSVAYSGTNIVGGRGEGIVYATGVATELGRIAGSLTQTERRRSPLQRELDRLVRILVVVAVGLIAITVVHGIAQGRPLGANVLAGISAAIAAIPEEPPVLLAVILGLGAYRLLKRGVLVRRLSAQETLGSIDTILTDKTGTLTENRLRLGGIWTPDGPITESQAEVAVLSEALRAEEDAWDLASRARVGSFTRCLLEALRERGAELQLDASELVDTAAASHTRAWSQVRFRRQGQVEELLLGAPEVLIGLAELPEDELAAWHDLIAREAGAGGRLLLLARRIDAGPLVPIALLGFGDPIRPGVPEAMAVAARAGIQTIVVTGDHRNTAAAVARAAGIPADRILTGAELATWDDARLRVELPHLQVVARALPEQKLRLVDAARAIGRTVAVTGDGVNDAPALHHADVAVAMGSGTAVARDASDLVLGDDSFTTLLEALREGRRIVANVQKGLVFLISTHVALLGFILIATLAGFDQPLLPLQILWLELFIDLSTSVAFEREPDEPGAMERPPRPRSRPLLDRPLLLRISLAGGFSAVVALGLMAWHGGGFEHARWLAYTSLVLAQAVRAYANRSLSVPVTRLSLNGFLALACAVVVLIQVAIPAVPALAQSFHATPLDAIDWALAGSAALAPAIVADLVRRLARRTWVA